MRRQIVSTMYNNNTNNNNNDDDGDDDDNTNTLKKIKIITNAQETLFL